MKDKYFYIYSFENNEVKVTPHKYNPTGYYDNKFDYVDAVYRMFGKTDNEHEKFINLYIEKMVEENQKLYEEIKALQEKISKNNNLILAINSIKKVGDKK